MDKESIFQINAHVRYFAFAIGEENQISFAQLALGDEDDILLHVVGHTVEIEIIDLTIDVTYKTRAVDTILVVATVAVRSTHPCLDSIIKSLIVTGFALNAKCVDVTTATGFFGDCGDIRHFFDIFVSIKLAHGIVFFFQVLVEETFQAFARCEKTNGEECKKNDENDFAHGETHSLTMKMSSS